MVQVREGTLACKGSKNYSVTRMRTQYDHYVTMCRIMHIRPVYHACHVMQRTYMYARRTLDRMYM